MSIKWMMKVWCLEKTTGIERLVLLSLADNANDEGFCWPSITTIAKKVNCSERYVQKILPKLVKDGFIKIDKRFSGNSPTSNLYQLVFTTLVNHSSPPGEHVDTTLVNTCSPEPLINHQLTTNESCVSFSKNENDTRAQEKPRKERKTDPSLQALLEIFLRESKLPRPLGTTVKDYKELNKLWFTPLRQILSWVDHDQDKAGFIVAESIRAMRKDNLTISNPNSIYKVATYQFSLRNQ